jgi:pantoate--beta-alanine ligase
MGALHEGHRSLIRRARAEMDFAAISIFVNPLQFGPGEDFERYPRKEETDLAVATSLGVDVVFAPDGYEMYPPGSTPDPVITDPGPIGGVLEGASRPGHFRGVLAAVHRLLEIAGRCSAYFGEKDAQQLFLVRRMVLERAIPVEVVACPTVRAPDGVALSSRNAYLSREEREAAGCLFLALSEAAEHSRMGETGDALVAVMAREIGATPLARIDYAAVVDEETFEQVHEIRRPARALVAAWFGRTRLIDNLRLPEPGR